MINRLFPLLIISFLFVGSNLANAQEGDKKEKNPDHLKSENWKKWGTDPIPVLSPEESLETFRVAPGFRVELVAAEPLVRDPVFAEWDNRGRLWVCEFNTYMIDLDGSDENQRVSRVVVLEDLDGDGRMDQATPFLEDMINPRSLSIVNDGVLVVESGKLWHCRDTDGDLVCDEKEAIIDFATAAPSNIEHAENGLHFSIDNWMYNSKSDRRVKWKDGELLTDSTIARGQWGMATDAYGRLYHNVNSRWFTVDWGIYDKAWPAGDKKEVAASDRSVYPIHPTPALNRAYQPGMLNERGNPKGVTSVSGLAVHSSGSFGEEWEGVIFSFSPGTNTVGAFKPDLPFPETVGYEHILTEDPEVGKREFLASTDTRFRPVNGSFGPDGCLYIVDFHRGVIQHKKFLTSYLRKQSEVKELDQHIGYGRIYRVVPEGHEPVPAPENLVAGLDHDYLWWRLNSQKQIVEGARTDLLEKVRSLAVDATASPFGRAHALWTLAGLEELDEEKVIAAIRDPDWFVSMTGLRLAGAATDFPDTFPSSLKATAREIAAKDRPVLSAYAGTLGTIGYPNRVIVKYKDREPGWVKKDKGLSRQYQRGRTLYATSCGACHQPHGKGMENMAPTLLSDWVNGDPDRLIAVALNGLTGPIEVNGEPVTGMPPIMPPHHFMNDEQLADILTYIRNAWGNRADPIGVEQVAEFRKAHASRVLPWTSAELDALK